MHAEKTAGKVSDTGRLIRLRGALYGGVSGSLGATFGWFLWIAVVAWLENWKEVAGAVIAGASVGFAVHILEKYVEVAREESAGPISRAERQRRKHRARHHTQEKARAAVFAGALFFLALACEHLVSHVINMVLLPFLASVVGFFVPGACFAYYCWHLPYGEPPDLECGEGAAWAGIVSGITVGAIFSIMNRIPSGFPALAWWCSFSICVGAVYVLVGPLLKIVFRYQINTSFHRLAPVLAVSFLICLTLSFSDPSNQRQIRENRKSPDLESAISNIWVDAVNQMLASGDLPETFWKKADEGLRRGAMSGSSAEHVPRSKWGVALARRIGCDAAPRETQDHGSSGSGPQESADEGQSQAVLCQQLTLGFASGLLRSWFVLTTFTVGLTMGFQWERKLRPAEYGPESETRRQDLSALNWIVLTMVVLVGYICWHRI